MGGKGRGERGEGRGERGGGGDNLLLGINILVSISDHSI